MVNTGKISAILRASLKLGPKLAPKLAIALGAVAAYGCASNDLNELRELPSYHVGYGDGCQTSHEEDKSFSTKSTRDKYAFENDEAYRAGWRHGWLECNQRTPDAVDGGRILGERNEY